MGAVRACARMAPSACWSAAGRWSRRAVPTTCRANAPASSPNRRSHEDDSIRGQGRQPSLIVSDETAMTRSAPQGIDLFRPFRRRPPRRPRRRLGWRARLLPHRPAGRAGFRAPPLQFLGLKSKPIRTRSRFERSPMIRRKGVGSFRISVGTAMIWSPAASAGFR